MNSEIDRPISEFTLNGWMVNSGNLFPYSQFGFGGHRSPLARDLGGGEDWSPKDQTLQFVGRDIGQSEIPRMLAPYWKSSPWMSVTIEVSLGRKPKGGGAETDSHSTPKVIS